VTEEPNSQPLESSPLLLVSNRGPVTFDVDGSFTRGGGGLVTALTGLASHRRSVWIASAMSDGDLNKLRDSDGKPFEVSMEAGGEYQVRLVASDDEAYDRFYNRRQSAAVVHPALPVGSVQRARHP